MSRCSRTPTRTALPALRGRRRSSSRAAGAAMPPLAATVAATVPPRGGDGPSTLDDPPRTPAKPQLALDVSPGLLPLRVVQLLLPLPQSFVGVFQNLIDLKYAAGALAWYCAHEP